MKNEVYSIYMDENGDLGYSDSATKHLVITLLIVKNPRDVNRCLKKVKQKLMRKKDKLAAQELKFTKATELVRKRTLEALSKENLAIYSVILEKHKVYDYLRSNQNEVYNYTARTLFDKIDYPQNIDEILIRVDKRSSEETQKAFNTYIALKITELFLNVLKRAKVPIIKVEHLSSLDDPCLQAVDMISGAIFQKYERKNNEYVSIVKDKIKIEYRMFSDKK